ncbi:MAG: SDR family NAD(P)-dependent oxidoreductase, partial [Actinomycetota bacterium]|nr:SDR family NAD(P)-dependent oxidoreductase [Actinomycetota bacterium]
MITGASRGLGRALTLACAEEGANLVITSRSAESFEPVAKEAEGRGVEVL